MRYRIVIPKLPRVPGLRRLAVLLMWIVGGGGLIAAVFVASFYLAMRVEMSSTEVKVPDLAGMSLEVAGRAVEPVDLVLEVVEQRHDPTLSSGRILQQVPPAGASVRRGRKVKLVLSLGGRVLDVPRFVGKGARSAEIELRQQDFVPGDEARVHFRGAGAGQVIAQAPPPGTPAVPRTRVHRLVSEGAPVQSWVMPDLSGLTLGEAERWIATTGFRRGAVREVPSRRRRRGAVIGQLPLAGYPIRTRDVVELTIAR